MPNGGLNEEQGAGDQSCNAEHDDPGMKALRDEIAEAMWRDYIN